MTVELDTKGMNCPLPIVKTKKAMKSMGDGEEIRIEATDPGATADFEAFCRATGNELVSNDEDDGIFTFVIKKVA
jgi:tRNA 2-thiouridine synthesizing protein A